MSPGGCVRMIAGAGSGGGGAASRGGQGGRRLQRRPHTGAPAPPVLNEPAGRTPSRQARSYSIPAHPTQTGLLLPRRPAARWVSARARGTSASAACSGSSAPLRGHRSGQRRRRGVSEGCWRGAERRAQGTERAACTCGTRGGALPPLGAQAATPRRRRRPARTAARGATARAPAQPARTRQVPVAHGGRGRGADLDRLSCDEPARLWQRLRGCKRRGGESRGGVRAGVRPDCACSRLSCPVRRPLLPRPQQPRPASQPCAARPLQAGGSSERAAPAHPHGGHRHHVVAPHKALEPKPVRLPAGVACAGGEASRRRRHACAQGAAHAARRRRQGHA